MTPDDLRGLVAVDRADVYRAGERVATLTRRADAVEFEYLPEAIGGPPVASTLPAAPGKVVTPGRAVPPFFAGVLPEGRRLTALRSAVKTSADDDFSMLLAVGGDVVGDIQIVPEGVTPPAWDQPVGAADFDTVSFTELFAAATGRTPDQVGLAGVQDKVSGRMISVPVAHRGGAYLLKLDPPEFPHLVANEEFFLRMARDCGLDVVEAVLIRDRDARPGLLVRRFDRSPADGRLVPHAVEDGCQVLGRYPADKYAMSYAEVFAGLAAVCPARLVAVRALVRQLVVAVITGNGDLHAKNVSVVRTGPEWKVAPAYDVPSSHPYGDTTLALTLAGRRDVQVSRRRVVELAGELGMPERAALLILDDVLERAEPWPDRLGELPFDERRLHDLRRVMSARMRLLRG